MRIECTTTFLDGRERFEVGDIFTVDDERGAYFVKCGWAKEPGAADTPPATTEPVSLDIQNVLHKTEVSHG